MLLFVSQMYQDVYYIAVAWRQIPCCRCCNSCCLQQHLFCILLFHIFGKLSNKFQHLYATKHFFITFITAKPHVNVQTDSRNQACGTPSGVPNGLSQYIVGGSIANTDAWPWQVKCAPSDMGFKSQTFIFIVLSLICVQV